ncbi:hypothetical protein [Sedimentitalea sp.]|uniref:hypothetical protein n=1 Tax=Sedimentitalea sp. TaxID=2048915 RepID=UPI003299DD40
MPSESTGLVRPAGAAEDTARSILVARARTRRVLKHRGAVAFGLPEPQGTNKKQQRIRDPARAAKAIDTRKGGSARPRSTMPQSPHHGSDETGCGLLRQEDWGWDVPGASRYAAGA